MTPHYVIKWNSLRSLHFHQYLSYHRHGFNGIHGLPFFILGSHPPPPSLSLPHHHPFSTQSTLSPNPSSSSSSSSTVTTTPTSTHPFPSLATTSIVTFSESEVHSFSTKDVTSYLRSHPFEESINQLLLAPIQVEDIEVKPDGLLYLPEIKYRRILNQAFKPGGWSLIPRSPHSMAGHMISREYALFIHGHYVSQARGEQEVFQPHFLPTAMEGCRSNALMRCCKDLGIASELWDPTFIKAFRKKYLEQVWVKHKTKGNVLKLWRKKVEHGGDVEVEYPYELMPSKK